MGNIVFSQAAKFLQKRRNTRRWIAVVLCLALVVTSGTFGALTRHGSALTGADQILDCVYEGHVHSEECYDEAGELICGYADYCVHEHNESCYDSEGNLVCRLPEIPAHVHDESCYAEEEQLICEMEENEIHQHTDDCYDIELEDIVCELEEHVHDDSCYELITEGEEIPENGETVGNETPVQNEEEAGSEAPVQSEVPAESEAPAQSEAPAESEAPAQNEDAAQSERPAESENPAQNGESAPSEVPQNETSAADTATAQSEEPAVSTEAEQGEAPAENAEPAGDGEINECAESRRLICEMEEHTHGNECYNQNKVLKCGKEESSEAHIHSEECYDVKKVAVCGKLELHTHSEECYTDGKLTCGEVELAEHVHNEDCFKKAPVMELSTVVDGVTVTVTATEEDIIPDGAQVSVTPVVKTDAETLEDETAKAEAEALNAKYDEIQQGLEASMEEDETKELKHFQAYDINFYVENENNEKEEVQLGGDVTVKMEFNGSTLPEEITSDETVRIDSVDLVDIKETEEGLKPETVQDAVVDTTQDDSVQKAEMTISGEGSTIAFAWIGEINPETGEYLYEDDEVIIRVTPMAEDILPEDAKLQVIPITASEKTGEQYQQVAEKLLEKAESKEYEIAGFLAYDISFVDEDGNKIEPNGEVKVAMNYKEAKIPAEVDAATYAFAAEEAGTETEAEPGLDVKVMHLEEDEEGSVSVVDMAEQQKVTALETTEEQKIQNAEFVTGGFSVFTITWTWDTSKPYVYEDDDVKITVTAIDKDAIPEGTTLSITPIKADDAETAQQYQEVARKLMEKAAQEAYNVVGFLAYDISLINKEGAEIEPNGKVKVTMEYMRPMAVVEIDPNVYALVSQELGLTEEETADDTEASSSEETTVDSENVYEESIALDMEALHTDDVSEAAEGTVEDVEQIADEADETEGDDSKAETEQYEITVVHLEEGDQGEVTQVVDMAEAGQVQAIEKTEQQEVCKAEFVTDSFSKFVLAWNGIFEDGIFKEGTKDEMDVKSIMDQITLPAGKNNWQIVDEKYTGNGFDNKEAWPRDESVEPDVRVQKNVIPTDVENEFLVYLSIDTKSIYERFFDIAEFKGTSSSNYKTSDEGKVKDAQTGNEKITFRPVDKEGKNTFKLTVYDSQNNLLIDHKLYEFSGANGVLMYLELPGGQWLIMGADIGKSNVTNSRDKTIHLDETAEGYLKDLIREKVTLGTVEDTMGKFIEFQGFVAGDYLNEPEFKVDEQGNKTKTLVWTPAPKGKPEQREVEKNDEEGNILKDVWSLNVAELLYKVRLKVEDSEFKSCAEDIKNGTTNNPDTSCEVNESAVLTYDNGKTAIFPKPHVRGLLYDLTLQKRAKDTYEKDLGVLEGATFVVKDDEGKLYDSVTTESDGIIRFTGLPWGNYTVTETGAPSGYEGSQSIGPIELCYTNDNYDIVEGKVVEREGDKVLEVNGADMIHKDYNETPDSDPTQDSKLIMDANVIYNLKTSISVTVIKEWVDRDNSTETELGTRPPSIKFKLLYKEKEGDGWQYYEDANGVCEYEIVPSGDGTWKYIIDELPAGCEYKVEEISVPGYTTSYYPEKTSSDETELTICNVLQTQIVKRSSSSTDLKLPGAIFSLTGMDIDWTGTSGTDGTIEWKSGSETVPMEKLPDGQYSMTETSAPAGYARSGDVWTITVEKGLVKSIQSSTDGEVVAVNEGGIQTFYFDNEPVYALPSTGGSGIYWYSIGGTLLMMAGALILYRNKNKKVRGCRRA